MSVKKISEAILGVGVDDTTIDLFESQYPVPTGVSYNSYVILDEKTAVLDTVDARATEPWLENLSEALAGRKPDYLVVSHMEPDHGANIAKLAALYPEMQVVGNAKTFLYMDQFFGADAIAKERRVVVKDGESLSLGAHTLTFVFAPMVHWPEVMVSYESAEKVLFSADGFGRFGAVAKFDEKADWASEARRYYLNIVGKYGPQVQALLGDRMAQAVNPSLAPYAKTGEVMLRLTAKGDSPAACEERMAPLLEQVRGRLGAYLYGIDVSGLEETVLHLLHQHGKTFSAAESCTGGLIAKRITDLPGASCVFRGGVVSYTNEVKASVLGVPQETLDRYGAVSEPVARAMAEGVRRITGSDLSVATTGLAGPDGDDRGNPVGTVFVALSTPERTVVRHMNCGSGRDRVRMLASHCAFDLLRRELEHLPIEGE